MQDEQQNATNLQIQFKKTYCKIDSKPEQIKKQCFINIWDSP